MTELRRLFMPLLTVAGGLGISLLPTPAWACTLGSLAGPSQETRQFISDRHRVAVTIPANYRALLLRGGDIAFHDPVTFDYVQCLVRSGRYGAVPLHTTLEISPVANPNLALAALVRQRRPWLDFYRPSFEATEWAGRQAVRYGYVHEIHRVPMANVSGLGPDGRTLFTLSGPANDPTVQRAIASFQFLN